MVTKEGSIVRPLGQNGTLCKLALAMQLVVSAILCLINFDYLQVGTYLDDAHYIVLARSLASGLGYVVGSYPTPATEIPWPVGYPLLLAPLVAVWPDSFVPLKLLSLALTLGSILLTYVVFVRLEDRWSLLPVILLYGLNPYVVSGSGMVMSEPAFICLSLLAIYLCQGFLREGSAKWYHIPLIGLALAWVFMVRLIGLALLGAVLLDLLLRRQWKTSFILGLTFFLFALPQFLLSLGAGVGSAASGVKFSSLLEIQRTLTTLWDYVARLLPQILFGAFGPSTYLAAGSAYPIVDALKASLLLLIVVGFILTAKKHRILIFYILLYLSVLGYKQTGVIGLETDAEGRYLIPLLPFLYYFFIEGALHIARWCAKMLQVPRLGHFTVAILVSILLILFIGRNVLSVQRPMRDRITDISIGTTWISENTPSDAIVVCRSPFARHLYANRLTLDFPNESVIQGGWDGFLETNKATYVLVAPRMQVNTPTLLDSDLILALDLMRRDTSRFKLVYSNQEHNVWLFSVLLESEST